MAPRRHPRLRLTWLLTVPIMAIGSLAGHTLAYRLVAPDAHAREHLLEQSGHGYLRYAPLFLALCASLVLVALALRAAAAFGRRAGPRAPAWAFALLPPLGFVAQELLERFVHSGHLHLAAAVEPTFLVGLCLQVPFALAALLIARLLLGFADSAGRAFAAFPRPRLRGARTLFLTAPVAAPPRIPALALGYGERGPPSIS